MKNKKILIILMMVSIFLPSTLMSEVGKDNAALADCGKRLEEAFEVRAQKETEYQEALSDLKKLLLKAFMRLGVTTGVMLVDATTDLQVAIKQLKDSVTDNPEALKEAVKANRAKAEMLAEFDRLTRKAAANRAVETLARRTSVAAELNLIKAKRAAQAKKPEPERPSSSQVAKIQAPQRTFKTKGMEPNMAEQDKVLGLVYLTSEELRQKHLITVKDGKLCDPSGNLLDTRHVVGSHGGPPGRAIYVMDKDGNIFLHTEPEFGKMHHSNLSGGEEVAGAGQMRIEDGTLVVIDRNSGHYRCSPEYTEQVVQRLQDLGVDTSGVVVDHF